MREIRHNQLVLTRPAISHRFAQEMEAISAVLDEHPTLADLVHHDLTRHCQTAVGAHGLSAEQVLRIALLKQLNDIPYEWLAFHLEDSATFRRFCRLPWGVSPARSTLQALVTAITEDTWNALHRHLVREAIDDGVDTARRVRSDCTVTHTDIHRPDDAAQLWDVVRVLTRLLLRAKTHCPTLTVHRRLRRAKRRYRQIHRAKTKAERRRLYRDLLGVAETVCQWAQEAATALDGLAMAVTAKLADRLRHYLSLGRHVAEQARRRVLQGVGTPNSARVVSLFEPHTDVIVKSGRKVEYGHKVCLGTGKSGLVVDVAVLSGNINDSQLVADIVQRLEQTLGRVPQEMAFDGGFSSRANLRTLKSAGVKRVCFSKYKGMSIEELAGSRRSYRRLWRFRAGVEGGISTLKRRVGLSRCRRSGEHGFKAHVISSVVAYNLLIHSRYRLARAT